MRGATRLPIRAGMAAPLSFTPPGRIAERVAAEPVRRRHVLFVPGYDPEGERRYRMLFVRELIRYGKRFDLAKREISRVEPLPDLPGLRWRLEVATEAWSTSTTYDVLRWDDIVLRDFARPLPLVVLLLFAGLIYSLLTGMVLKFFRLNWKFGGVVLYPSVVIAAALAGSAGVGFALDALIALAVPATVGARTALVLGLAGLVFCACYPVGERWFVWHLMHDWVFNWQAGIGRRPDYERRAARFAEHLLEVAKAGACDEILLVGHSSGASLALDVLGRALEQEPEFARRSSSRIALLTIGTCVPLLAINPMAKSYHRRMRGVMTCPDVFWAEYQAPQDWINVAGFNALRDVPFKIEPGDCVNPVVRSSRFRETMAEASYRSIVYRPFRMHFQFLIANDRPGEYDYIMMTTGPLTLQERVRLGPASVETGPQLLPTPNGASTAGHSAKGV